MRLVIEIHASTPQDVLFQVVAFIAHKRGLAATREKSRNPEVRAIAAREIKHLDALLEDFNSMVVVNAPVQAAVFKRVDQLAVNDQFLETIDGAKEMVCFVSRRAHPNSPIQCYITVTLFNKDGTPGMGRERELLVYCDNTRRIIQPATPVGTESST